MSQQSSEEVYQLRQMISDILIKEFWLILLIILSISAVISWIVWKMPTNYRVAYRFHLQSLFTGQSDFIPWNVHANSFNNNELRKILYRRGIPQSVRDALGLDEEITPSGSYDFQTTEIGPDSSFDYRVPKEPSSILEVNFTYESKSKFRMVEIIKEAMILFHKEMNLSLKEKLSDLQMQLNDSLTHLESKLVENNNNKNQLQSKYQTVSLENELNTTLSFLLQKKEELELLQGEIETQQKLLKQKEQELKEQLEAPLQLSIYDLSFGNMKNRLLELDAERESLLQIYDEQHPKIKMLDSQILTLKRQVDLEEKKYENSLNKISLNPMTREIFNAKTALEKKLFELKGRQKSLGALLSMKETRYESLKNIEKKVNVFDTLEDQLLEEKKNLRKNLDILAINIEKNLFQFTPIADVSDPSPYKNPLKRFGYLLGFIIALVIASVWVFVKYSFSGNFMRCTEVEQFFPQRIYGFIIKSKISDSFSVFETDSSHASECFRKLRSSIQFLSPEAKKICVCSADKGDGKTFTSFNLAVSLAFSGSRVILVDSDLKKPTLHRYFDIKNTAGFNELLKECAVEEVIHQSRFKNLHFLCAGEPTNSSSDLMRAERIDAILALLCHLYDYVIFDTSPLTFSTESYIIARYCDLSLITLALEQTRITNVEKVLNELQTLSVNNLGLVINLVRESELFGANSSRGYR
jgi:capsular exopolysaccharide synthesis family protein